MKKLIGILAALVLMTTPAMAHDHRHGDNGLFWGLLGGVIIGSQLNHDHYRDHDRHYRDHYYSRDYDIEPDERFVPNGHCVEVYDMDQYGDEHRYVRCY